MAKESRTKRAWFASAKNLSLNLQRIAPEAGLWFAEKILFRRITKNLLGTEIQCIILGGSHTQQEQLKRIEQVIRTKLSLVELSGRPEVSGLEGEVCQEESQEEYITKISIPVAK